MSDYLQDYHALGLEPGCNLRALKSARRRLVQSWHPDRFPHPSEAKQHAEQRIKEINTAFDRLIVYHRNFGVLPGHTPPDTTQPTATSPASPRGSDESRSANLDRHSHGPEAARRHFTVSIPWRLVLVVTLTLVVVAETIRTVLDPDALDGQPNTTSEPSLNATTAPISRTIQKPSPPPANYFSLGSSLGDVYAIQGIPSATENGAWHYGKSTVYFSDGVVIGWHHDTADPLKIALLPSTAKREADLFTFGSTKAEVRAIQGAPLVETDTLWDFGLSKVYFRDDRVVGWDSSPMYPLKARK